VYGLFSSEYTQGASFHDETNITNMALFLSYPVYYSRSTHLGSSS